ncbi:MAG TPA: hypothetical protein GXX40_06740 [Firmicutes bacterium]|nr:hypothetical protein [Bacillota bacterium]
MATNLYPCETALQYYKFALILLCNDESRLDQKFYWTFPNKVAAIDENAEEAIRLREALHEMRKYLRLDYFLRETGLTRRPITNKDLAQTKQEFIDRMTQYFEKNSWPE